MTNKDEFIKKYMDTISNCKTEREWVSAAELIALTQGFNKFNRSLSNYKPGDKVYFINRKKNFAAFIIGKDNTISQKVKLVEDDLKKKKQGEKRDFSCIFHGVIFHAGMIYFFCCRISLPCWTKE